MATVAARVAEMNGARWCCTGRCLASSAKPGCLAVIARMCVSASSPGASAHDLGHLAIVGRQSARVVSA